MLGNFAVVDREQLPNTPTSQANVSPELGWASLAMLREDLDLQEAMGSDEFEIVSQAAMRWLATERYHARKNGEVNMLNQPPTTVQAEIIRTMIRRAAIIKNVAAYQENFVERQHEHGARPEQVEALDAFWRFVRAPATGGTTEKNTLSDMLSVGSCEVAGTGFGKTFVMAKIAESMGIGTTNFLPVGEPPLRALLLVNTKINGHQIIGEHKNRSKVDGFKKYASGLRVSQYFDGKNDMSGDAITVTYSGFCTSKDVLPRQDIDAIFCDEAQYLLGDTTAQTFSSYRKGKVAFGVTASEQYSETKRLTNVLPDRLYLAHPRHLIEIGRLRTVRLFAVTTNEVFYVDSQSQDYTDTDLAALAHSDKRNALLLAIVEQEVSSGRPVVGRVIKGDDCWHAKYLATEASKIGIIDPRTGELRKIRAAFVGGKEIKNRNNAAVNTILEEWEQGELDVLFYVEKLKTSWNSHRPGSLILGCPTTSRVDVEQEFGRGLRINKEWPVLNVYQLLDRILDNSPRRHRQYTVWDVLEEPYITQGAIIGKKALHPEDERVASEEDTSTSSEDVSTSSPEETEAEPTTSAQIIEQALEDAKGVFVEDWFVGVQHATYDAPPKDWVLFSATQHLWQGMDPQTTCRLIQNTSGIPDPIISRTEHGPRRYISPEAIQFLETYKVPDLPDKNMQNQFEIGVEINTSWRNVRWVINDLDLTGKGKDCRLPNQPHLAMYEHFYPAQVTKIKNRLQELMTFEKGDISIQELAWELNLPEQSISHRIEKDSLPTFLKISRSTDQRAAHLHKPEADRIREYYKDKFITGERRAIVHIMQETGASKDAIQRTMDELNLSMTDGGIYVDYRGIYQNAPFLEGPDANLLRETLKSRQRPANSVSLDWYASTRQVAHPTAAAAIKQANIPVSRVERPSNTRTYIPNAYIEEVDGVLQKRGKITAEELPQPEADDTGKIDVPLLEALNRLHCTGRVLQLMLPAVKVRSTELVSTVEGGIVSLKESVVQRLEQHRYISRAGTPAEGWVSHTKLMTRLRSLITESQASRVIKEQLGGANANWQFCQTNYGGGEVVDVFYEFAVAQRSIRQAQAINNHYA